jgi:outer membrane receptor for ferrienterochelin and colicin
MTFNFLTKLVIISVVTFSLCNVARASSKNNDKKDELDGLELKQLLDIKISVVSKKDENISDAPGIISVVTQDELRRSGATTLREALLRVPSTGISTTALTSRSLLVMRGDNVKMNSGHILFLINGRPVREVQEGGVNGDFYESFPVSCIEQIEVIRGPGSVLYGSDAFSGVINVKTKQPSNEGAAVSASGYYLIKDGAGVTADGMLKREDLNIAAAVQYLKMPEWKPKFYNAYVDWSHPELGFLDTLVDDLPINGQQGPGCMLNVNYKGLSTTASFLQSKATGFQIKCDVTNRKYFGNIAYDLYLFDRWNTNINFTGTRSELFTDMRIPTPNPAFVERHSNNLLLENTHFINISYNLNAVVGGTVNYIEGYEMGTDDLSYTNPLFLVSKGNRWAFSGYTQIDYTPIEQLKFFGGLQVNKTKNIKSHLAPRLGGIWHPHENISIKSCYSEAFRLPSINELYMDFKIGIYGDERLKPEIVKTFDQSISFHNDRFLIGVTYFHSRMHDIIQQASKEGLNWWEKQYQNVGEITFNGVEFEAKSYITKELYINGSVLYQDNRDSVYNTIPFANLIAKAGVSYSNNQGLTLSLFDVHNGPTPEKFHGNINQSKQGPYDMLNFASVFEMTRLLKIESKVTPSIIFKIDNIIGNEQMMWEYGGFTNEAIPTLRGRVFYLGCNVAF